MLSSPVSLTQSLICCIVQPLLLKLLIVLIVCPSTSNGSEAGIAAARDAHRTKTMATLGKAANFMMTAIVLDSKLLKDRPR